MMHKAWSSIEEVPYCFWRSSVKFQGHTAKKIFNFDPDWAFPDCNSSLKFTNGYEMMHKAWSSIEEVPYCFWRSSVKFQGHSAKKNRRFWPKLGFLDRKIDNLNPIWVRLLGRSQLSNPSDLPCLSIVYSNLKWFAALPHASLTGDPPFVWGSVGKCICYWDAAVMCSRPSHQSTITQQIKTRTGHTPSLIPCSP